MPSFRVMDSAWRSFRSSMSWAASWSVPGWGSAIAIDRSRHHCRRPAIPWTSCAGLLAIHAFKTLYVADLDAIAGSEDNRAALMRLKAEFPQLTLWVDNGICERDRAQRWLAAGWGKLVLGSETQVDAALVRHLAGDSRVALSLDFRGPSFQGPPALLDETDWLAANGDRHDPGAGGERCRTGPRHARQHPRCRAGPTGLCGGRRAR